MRRSSLIVYFLFIKTRIISKNVRYHEDQDVKWREDRTTDDSLFLLFCSSFSPFLLMNGHQNKNSYCCIGWSSHAATGKGSSGSFLSIRLSLSLSSRITWFQMMIEKETRVVVPRSIECGSWCMLQSLSQKVFPLHPFHLSSSSHAILLLHHSLSLSHYLMLLLPTDTSSSHDPKWRREKEMESISITALKVKLDQPSTHGSSSSSWFSSVNIRSFYSSHLLLLLPVPSPSLSAPSMMFMFIVIQDDDDATSDV